MIESIYLRTFFLNTTIRCTLFFWTFSSCVVWLFFFLVSWCVSRFVSCFVVVVVVVVGVVVVGQVAVVLVMFPSRLAHGSPSHWPL